MAIYEAHSLSGRLTIELLDPQGQVLMSQRYDNLITSAGQTLVAQLFTGEVAGKPELAIAIGSGGTQETVADTALYEPLDEALASTEAIQIVHENDTQRAVAKVSASLPALPSNQSQVIREAGVLMRFPNRTPLLYNRVTFPEITRTANLEMNLTWEVLF